MMSTNRIPAVVHNAAIACALFAMAGISMDQAYADSVRHTFKATIVGQHTLSGTLHLPRAGKAPFPAVIVIHGTAGPDTRYTFHRGALLAAGFAAFEVDFQRGVYRSARDRPPPSAFIDAVYAAVDVLRADKRIDGDRIGMLGFSLGGSITLAARHRSVYKAAVVFYSGCANVKRAGMGRNAAPILMFVGDRDSYGSAACYEELAKEIGAELKIYPGVYHGFDRAGEVRASDPLASGSTAVQRFDASAATDARSRLVEFFREKL